MPTCNILRPIFSNLNIFTKKIRLRWILSFMMVQSITKFAIHLASFIVHRISLKNHKIGFTIVILNKDKTKDTVRYFHNGSILLTKIIIKILTKFSDFFKKNSWTWHPACQVLPATQKTSATTFFLGWDQRRGDVPPTLGAALLCSSRAASDLGLYPDLITLCCRPWWGISYMCVDSRVSSWIWYTL